MNHIKHIFKPIWLVCVLMALMSSNSKLEAQDKPVYSVILKNSAGIVVVNLVSKQVDTLYSFQEETPQMHHEVAVDTNNEKLYVISRLDKKLGPPNRGVIKVSLDSEVNEVNLLTGEKTVIFRGHNLLRVFLSPNGDKAVLTYFSPDNALLTTFCILDLANHNCEESGMDIDMNNVYWIDNEHVLITSDFQLAIYSVIDATLDILQEYNEWLAVIGRPLPEQNNKLLVVGKMPKGDTYESTFTIFSVGNRQIEELPIRQHIVLHLPVDNVKISPDETYLVYGVDDSYMLTNMLVDDGLVQFNNIQELAWLPDSSGLVGVSLVDSANPSYTLFHYDIQSDSFSVLAEYSTYISIEGIVGSDS